MAIFLPFINIRKMNYSIALLKNPDSQDLKLAYIKY